MLQCGQGILLSLPRYIGQMPFKSTEPTKKRPFLVVGANPEANVITLLNVTSDQFDDAKQAFIPGLLKIYDPVPPFETWSLVQSSGVYIIEYFSELEKRVLADGKSLNSKDYIRITERMKSSSALSFNKNELLECNDF